MLKLTSSLFLVAMTVASIVGINAAPSPVANRVGYYGRRDGGGSDSSSSSSNDYSSDYYKWVPVEYSKCTGWSAYDNYNLVKADSYDKDKTDIYVCLVKFSKDNSYRIGWFDPSVSFVCTVVYMGDAVEAKDDTYDSYYLSIEDKYEGYWATWDEISKYQDDQIVYAPDHDCVTGEVCWTDNSGGGFTTYSAPNGDKTDRWGSGSGSGSSSNSRRRRGEQSQVQVSTSWTRNLGRRDDYNKGNNEYASPTTYCYIGYGSSVTDYKVYYAYDSKAYQSDDIRYDGNVKVLIIIISSGSGSGSGYNGNSGSSSSSSSNS